MLTQEMIAELTKNFKVSLKEGINKFKEQIKGLDNKKERMETKLTQNTQKMEDLMETIRKQEIKIEEKEEQIKERRTEY